MIDSFVLEYFLLVFVASIGVFQMAAAGNRLYGLLFLQRRGLAFALGLAIAAGAFAWFFFSEPRNLPDTTRGLNGTDQVLYFSAGIAAGFAVTALASSLRNWRMGREKPALSAGLEALRYSNYLRALKHAMLLLDRSARWKRYRKSTAR